MFQLRHLPLYCILAVGLLAACHAYAQMRQMWQSQGADDRLVTQLWPGPHFFSQPMQQEVLRFFDRWLKGDR